MATTGPSCVGVLHSSRSVQIPARALNAGLQRKPSTRAARSFFLHVLCREREQQLLAAGAIEADEDSGIIARTRDRLDHAAAELLVLDLVAGLVAEGGARRT